MADRLDPLPASIVEGVARVLGATSGGLTGSEIASLLSLVRVDDPSPGDTKWRRLHQALAERQERDRAGNAIVRFIGEAMTPARYAGDHDLFKNRQAALNDVLIHAGLRVRDDGRVARVTAARTLDEAAVLANRLRAELLRRGTHAEVLKYCIQELIEQDTFHAVFEATKGVAERLREMTGVDADGSTLVDETLAPGGSGLPLLAINSLRTKTERSEQTGLANFIKGVFGLFRNTTAHRPRITWHIPEPDALDLFTALSLIHRRLDQTVLTLGGQGSSTPRDQA